MLYLGYGSSIKPLSIPIPTEFCLDYFNKEIKKLTERKIFCPIESKERFFSYDYII